jgi:hypothetical protein
VIGGGARVVAAAPVPVALSTRSPSGNAWKASAYATAATGNWQLTAFAICGSAASSRVGRLRADRSLRADGRLPAYGVQTVYDTLLFLHVLAALLLAVTAVTYSAVALGATAGGAPLRVADVCWNVGGLGTLILGIWLALYVDGYEVWDGWILGAIVLWAVATETGRRAQLELGQSGTGGATLMHWLRTLAVIALLVLMVWKPGA